MLHSIYKYLFENKFLIFLIKYKNRPGAANTEGGQKGSRFGKPVCPL